MSETTFDNTCPRCGKTVDLWEYRRDDDPIRTECPHCETPILIEEITTYRISIDTKAKR